MNSYIYRKDSGHMPIKSVKITEKNTSIREAVSAKAAPAIAVEEALSPEAKV